MVWLESIWPVAARRLKPSVATAIARTHMRMRVQEPMFTMSLIAPMLQKRVRCAMAPNTQLSAKPPHSTVVLIAWTEGGCICGTGLGNRTRLFHATGRRARLVARGT